MQANSLALVLCVFALQAWADAGRKSYETHCASCHQLDGKGADDVAPSLAGSAMTIGPPEPLVRFMLAGSGQTPSEQFRVPMPGYAHLSNAELARVLSYLRRSFGNRAAAVSAKQVRAAQ
jgi:alcohol dehydrogenase (quinone), cytochrome c subunit